MTVGAIMAYAQVSTAVAAPTRGPLVDHRFGRVYSFTPGLGSTNGARYFDSYPNGNEIRARAIGDIGVVNVQGPWTQCYRSQYVACVEDTTNGARVLYLRSTDFTLAGSFGTSDSSFTNSATHIENPNCIVSIVGSAMFAGTDVLICNSSRTDSALNAVVVGGLATQLAPIAENQCVLGALPDGSGAVAYAVGYTKLGAAAQIGLYRLTPAVVPVAKITAAAIDATWSHIDSVYGVTVDQTDGNLIIGVTDVTDVVTHPAYLVKLNATTGVVMWRVAVGAGISYDVNDSMRQNLVTKGVLYYLAPAGVLYTINTLTGVATTATLDTAAVGPLHVSQVSEDVTGSLYWYGSWSEGTSHPAYLGTYCLVQGNHSGTALTWRYFPNGTPSPAPTYGIPAQSRRRAWTMVLDGHVFYVLDLGAQGTFLYDDTTGNWCKFSTSGFTGWDVTNGTMWGPSPGRIVGGDFVSTDIWEMQPAATQDNGGLSITHVVSGGLVSRSRTYSSLESFNLAVSVGQLDNAAGATVLLEMSDDQGKTWLALSALALTQGDYSGEIAWRSLGAFNSPGRLFRITDVGGFIRIDGADASLDNFDEDKLQQSGD